MEDNEHLAKRILNLTFKIIHLLTGEDYTVVKKNKVRLQSISPNKSGELSMTQSTRVDPPSPPLMLEEKIDEKILDLTNKIIELLTEEVPIRYEDITVCFTMEEWEYVEGHKDLYKDVMMEDHQTLYQNITVESQELLEPEVSEDSPGVTELSSITSPVQDHCLIEGYLIQEQNIKPEKPSRAKEEDEGILSSSKVSVTKDFETQDTDVLIKKKLDSYQGKCSDSTHTKSVEKKLSINNLTLCVSGEHEESATDTSSGQRQTEDVSFVIKEEDCEEDGIGVQLQVMDNSPAERSPPMNGYEKEHVEKSGIKPTDVLENFRIVSDNDQSVPKDTNVSNRSIYEPGERSSSYEDLVSGEEGSLMDFDFYTPPDYVRPSFPDPAVDHNDPFACYECGKRFSSQANFFTHRKLHLRDKMLVCDDCGKPFTCKSQLIKHQRSHTGEKPFVCSECGKRFTQNSNLVTHQRFHTGEKPFSCTDCRRCFVSSSHLNAHQRSHSGMKPYLCPECGKCFMDRSNLVRHRRVHTGEKPFLCSQCGKCFTNRSALVRHQKNHTGGKLFVCSNCDRCFDSSVDLKEHQETHSGGKPFSCSDCGKCFANDSLFVLHQKTHAGAKPMPCAQCGKCFTDLSELLEHQRIHTREKPFSCSECGKRFILKSYLNRHLIIHKREELLGSR